MQEDKHNTGITGKCNGGREDTILALGLVTQQLQDLHKYSTVWKRLSGKPNGRPSYATWRPGNAIKRTGNTSRFHFLARCANINTRFPNYLDNFLAAQTRRNMGLPKLAKTSKFTCIRRLALPRTNVILFTNLKRQNARSFPTILLLFFFKFRSKPVVSSFPHAPCARAVVGQVYASCPARSWCSCPPCAGRRRFEPADFLFITRPLFSYSLVTTTKSK